MNDTASVKRWRLTFFLSVFAFLAFQGLLMFSHDLVVKILCAVVSLVYLASAAFSLRKAGARG